MNKLKFWNSPNKQATRGSVNGAGSDTRGTKRKAKPDPYEDIDEGKKTYHARALVMIMAVANWDHSTQLL
jgi:hypothetical protein